MGTTSVVAKLVALELEGSGGEVLDEVVRRWVVSRRMLERGINFEGQDDLRWVREAMGEL